MATALPARNIFDGTGTPTTSAMKAALGSLRDYLAEQLGTAGGAPTAIVSINGGQLAGLRNPIINGGMAVDQRNSGAAQTFTAGAALAYCVDRWYGYCTGANVTGQRVAGSGNTQYRYRFTGAASVTKIGFAQRIAADNSYYLNSRAVVVGVELSNSLLTTVTWTAWYANTTDTFGTLASPTRTQIGTGTITVTSTPTRYYVPITLPAAATTGIEIEFSVGAQISGTWTIGEVQLVSGSANELWREQRPINLERRLCLDYCVPLYFGHDFNASSTSQIDRVTYSFDPMRATPTVGALTLTTNSNATSITVTAVSASAVQLAIQGTAIGNVGADGNCLLTSEL